MDEQEQHKKINWELWFLITFSLLLIVVFIFYLPAWFAQRSIDLDDTHEDEGSMEMNVTNNEKNEDHPHDDDVDPEHGHNEQSSLGVHIAYAAEDEDHPHDDDVEPDHGHEDLSDKSVPWYENTEWWTRFVVSVLLLIALSYCAVEIRSRRS